MIYGGYQIVAGERRYRASRMAGLTEIPAIVRELTDSETMQIALIENLQRSDLTTLEEAMGYQTLMDEYDFSQEDVARIVGKSRSAVANTLRLLSLPDEVKDLLEQGKLSAGHARALLIVEDDKIAVDTARKIVSDGLSVRETEKLVKKTESAAPQKKKTSSVKKVTAYTEVELALTTALGTKVTVTENKNKKGGTLNIEFYDPEELFALTHKLEKLWE